jgi:dihydroneopterin triphosphate diphosphatase
MNHEIPIRCYGVSAIVVREHRKAPFLLLKRAAVSNGQWCQVAGGIESEETAWQAAVREILEETALVPERLYSADLIENFYEVGKDAVWVAPVFVAFVKAAATVIINHEHTEYRWVSVRTANAMLPFPGQRDILTKVDAAFVKRTPIEVLRIKQYSS